MHFTWQAQWDLLRPGDGAERRKMEFHLLNANPFSITQKKTLSVCLCVSVSVFALKERDCSKMQSNLWTNEKKKLLHPKFGSTIHLVSRVKSLCVLLDVVIRKGIPSVFKTEWENIYFVRTLSQGLNVLWVQQEVSARPSWVPAHGFNRGWYRQWITFGQTPLEQTGCCQWVGLYL